MSSNFAKHVSRRVLHVVCSSIFVRTLALVACAFWITTPSVWAQGETALASATLAALDTPTDDLIRLATEYADAVRDLKIARLNLDTVQRLPPNAVITNLEVRIAGLNCEAAQRKSQILRLIVEKQLAAAEDKVTVIHAIEKMGVAKTTPQPNYELVQTEATIKILRMILAMD